MKKNLILASGSPRRKMLLEWAELEFTVRTADTEEIILPGLTPEEVAVDIASIKANAVKQILGIEHSGSIIIAADTIVVLGNQIIGKPNDRDHAIEILSKLSGQQHRVITGVVMINEIHTESFFEETIVRFHPLSLEQITFYIDKYQPYDKAGAYAIQEWIGVVGIESISGDFYNVMGLPVSSVVHRLSAVFQYN
jgi:septum formation protein